MNIITKIDIVNILDDISIVNFRNFLTLITVFFFLYDLPETCVPLLYVPSEPTLMLFFLFYALSYGR